MISADEARRRNLGPFRGMAIFAIPSLLPWLLLGWLLVSRIT